MGGGGGGGGGGANGLTVRVCDPHLQEAVRTRIDLHLHVHCKQPVSEEVGSGVRTV